MADQRQRRVVQLLAEDGQLQPLLFRSQSDIGYLVMVGDILLQAGVHSIRDNRTPATVLYTEATGQPNYGVFVVRLNS